MSYTQWWHSLLLSFTFATWGLAQPLYVFILGDVLFQNVSGQSILLFMLLYHGAPVGILFLADRLVIGLKGPDKPLCYLRGALFVASLLVLLRVIQLSWETPVFDWVGSLPSVLKAAIVLVFFTTLGGLIMCWCRAAVTFAFYLSAASAIFTGVFIAEVGLLNEAWRDNAVHVPAHSLAEQRDTGPVFLILFDGLGGYPLFGQNTGDLTIDETRYPNFAALAADSAVFTNATANYFTTAKSVRSLLTGTWFADDGANSEILSGSASEGLLETLRDAGYLVEFYSNRFNCDNLGFFRCVDGIPVSGPSVHRVVRDFIVWLLPRPVARLGRDLTVNVLPTEVTILIPFNPVHQNSRSMWNRFISSTGPDSSGRFYFVHLLLPHQPYEFDREGNRVREVPSALGFRDFEKTAAAYRDQVMFVDTLMGELINKLKSTGSYDRSTIIITGDHGPRSLGLGRQFSGFERSSDYPDELNPIIPWVPLFLHGPQITPQVSPVEYQQIDLVPTVLDILGLPSNEDLHGVSAFSSQRPDRGKVFYGIPNKRTPGEKVTYLYDELSREWRKPQPSP
jgi:hypothetical protein